MFSTAPMSNEHVLRRGGNAYRRVVVSHNELRTFDKLVENGLHKLILIY